MGIKEIKDKGRRETKYCTTYQTERMILDVNSGFKKGMPRKSTKVQANGLTTIYRKTSVSVW